ncbi:hypothetical protein ACQEUX_12240 [Micromonospora sp. CA-259024]|uniref:hypothetical protein n=1 Tax=Micromonospora sp. CA-259024 TaxID=3239965 RepID=UPI003D91A9C8
MAKRTVGEFLAAIGFAAYDAGPLAEGWRFQRDTPGYVVVYKQEARVTADVLAAKLAAAKRYPDR